MRLPAGRSLLILTFAASCGLAGRSVAADGGPNADCPTAAEFATVKVDAPITTTRQRIQAGTDVEGKVETAPRRASAQPPVVVALRDEIAIHVHGLAYLLARERCSPTHRAIVLFLDGRPIANATPFPPVDPANETLMFVLDRREPSRDAWTHLLGRPSFVDRAVSISVGIEDEYAVASDQSVRLRAIPRGWFGAWAVLLALLAAAFLALATKSDVLRDPGPQPLVNARKPYSLAKMQAAWWFFLILSSYLFIGLVSGDYDTTITGTVLSLMGISAATAVGSATIDAGKSSAAATAATAATLATGVTVVVAPPSTRGKWWLDILSDGDGVNFHRFQMAAWTAVLGVIFLHEVYNSLAMPIFDSSLLGLLGISAGTYLGLKTTAEKG